MKIDTTNKMSPEVLIYIQSLKQYFKINNDARKYFDIESDDDKFFQYLGEISQKNFEENGEPELSLFQFEELRRKVSRSIVRSEGISGVFLALGELGYISLN